MTIARPPLDPASFGIAGLLRRAFAVALAALATSACGADPGVYTEEQFLDVIKTDDTGVPPLHCPANDPACECTQVEHCAAESCMTVSDCVDRRCVRVAKADCTACSNTTPCADDGDKCTVEECSALGECQTSDLDCNDNRGCTIDRCTAAAGCGHEDTCPAPAIDLAESDSTAEGAWHIAGTFTGSTEDHETFSATVDWGDGKGEQELDLEVGRFNLNHVYPEPGAFSVVVTITDNFGRKDSATVALTVTNLVAEIEIGADVAEVIDEGTVFDMHGLVADPGGNKGLVGTIDFGDGSDPATLTINPSGSFIAPVHRYGNDSDNGSFAVVIDISDEQGLTATATHNLTVRNVGPKVTKPQTPPIMLEGVEKTLRLALIEPGDDTLVGTVNIGTSSVPFTVEELEGGAKNLVLTLTYPNDGPQSVTYNLRDDDAPPVADSFVVDVENVAPEIDQHDDISGNEGSNVSTIVTFADPGADQLEWVATVDWGDSDDGPVSVPVNAALRTVALSHTYADNGSFGVAVTVADKKASDSSAFTVTVGNVSPQPNLGPNDTVKEGSPWTRSRIALDPGSDTLSGSVVYAGDAPEDVTVAANRGYTLNHTFPQDGTFPVALTISDDEGGANTSTIQVTVTNVAPTLDCGAAVGHTEEGQPFARTCTVSDPGDDTLTATVKYGEASGPGATDQNVAIANGNIVLGHTFTDEGNYSVTVTVHDDDTLVSKTIAVGVGDVPPLVSAGDDASVAEGSTFGGAGSIAAAASGDALTATVDYGDGGGSVPLTLEADGDFTLSHVYRQDGVYTITVGVTDGDGDTGSDALAVTVTNVIPTVDAGENANIDEGGHVVRSVTVTDPGADDVLMATIDAGRGTAPQVVAVAEDGTVPLDLAYPQDGVYTVTVSVDDGGLTPGTDDFTVTVANIAPQIGAIDDGAADEGDLVSRTIVVTDPGSDTFHASIDWGDGTTADTASFATSSSPISHRYADNGAFHAVVTLDDGSDGGVAVEDFTVTVSNVAPTLTNGTLVSVDEGSAWSYLGTIADVGSADTFTGEVRWTAAGSFVTFPAVRGLNTVTHTYPQDGSYAVSVKVSDDDGASVQKDVTAVIKNVAPAFELGAAAQVDEGATFTRNVTFTDPGADTWLADISYGDGSSSLDVSVQKSGFDVTHAYRNQGTFTLGVGIDDGSTVTNDSIVVTVKNVAPTVNAGGPTTLAEGGRLLRTTGTVTDPGLDDTFTATVNWGEGGANQALTISNRAFTLDHVFNKNGQFTVTVDVADDSGAHGTGSFVVTVSNTAPSVSAGADADLNEGDTLTRTVTFTDSGADDWSTMVDWGDGGAPESAPTDDLAKSVSLSHRYRQEGSYTVLVSVFDGTETGQGSFVVDVANVAPVVTLGAAGNVNEGAIFSRAGTFSDVGPDDIQTATVDWNDGTGPHALTLGAGTFNLSHAWSDNGTFDVKVAVDDGTVTTTQHLTVTVANVQPTVTAGTLVSVNEGSTWTFNGTLSDPGSADTFTGEVRWAAATSFSPFSIAAQGAISQSHVYAQDGSYAVTVRATDDDGATGFVDVTAVIKNVAPSFELGSGATINEGSTFTRSVTFTDPGADTWKASSDYGDTQSTNNVTVTAGVAFNVSHQYRDEGSYTLSVGINDGTDTTTDTATITVNNVAPTVSAGSATSIAEGTTFTRSGTVSDPGPDDVFTATIDWGEGGSPQPLTVTNRAFDLSHVYANNGSYTVVVDVADDSNAHGTTSFVVTVTNAKPVVAAGADANIIEGATFARTVSFTDAGADDWSATVDWGDGSASEAAPTNDTDKTVSLSHRYRQDGIYTATVSVFDGVDTGQDSIVITASNAVPSVSIGVDANVDEGTAFSRGGSFSDAGPDDPHTANVTYGDNSGTQGLTITGGTFNLSHTWGDNGSYPVHVAVTDDDTSGAGDITITVKNVAPTVADPGAQSANAGSRWQRSVTFSDPGADTWSATVDYGDGSAVVSFPSVTGSVALDKTYNVPGTYHVIVTVSDDDGGSGQRDITLNVTNVAPSVTGGSSVTINEGQAATVNATFTDPGTNTHTATVRWTPTGTHDAASVDEGNATVTGTHTYNDNGSFATLVTVTDQGGLSGTATVNVTVNNVAPVVEAGPDVRAIPDRHVTGTANFIDPGSDTWTALVNWGDGSGNTSTPVVDHTVPLDHTYSSDGTFTVTVRVTDDDGGTFADTFTVDARLQDCTGLDLTGAALWVGGASGNLTRWQTSDNWKDKTVPSASTPVVVCNNVENMPVVSSTSSNANALKVTLGSDATVSIDSGRTLTVAGDLKGGTVSGSGMTTLNADGALLSSTVQNLTVAKNAKLADDVLVNGTLNISNGATLDVNGFELDVSGTATIISGTTSGLIMTNANSEAIFDGTFSTSGLGNSAFMTAGTLRARGAFTQTGAGGGFVSGGTAVILDGTSAQAVTLAGGTLNKFKDLTVDNAAGVTFVSTLRVNGLLSLNAGTLTAGSGNIIELAGSSLPVVQAGATYNVTRTDVRSNMSLSANYTLSKADHTLVVREDGALTIGARTLTLGGDLTVYHSGTSGTGLLMTNSAGIVSVGGDLTFDNVAGATAGNFQLSAGTIKLNSDLATKDSANADVGAVIVAGTLFRFEGSATSHSVDIDQGGFDQIKDVTIVGSRTLDLKSTSVSLNGTLIHTGTSIATIKNGDLHSANADLEYVNFDNCRFSVDFSTSATDIDNTTFANMSKTVDQLSVSASAGSNLTLDFNGLTFATAPSTGRYIRGFLGASGSVVLNVTSGTPKNGSSKTTTSGNFTINWGSASDDTDGDTLTDTYELTNGTDPLDSDSDNDGFDDAIEIALGQDPNDSGDVPVTFGTTKSLTLTAGSGAQKMAVGQLNADANKEIAIANAGASSPAFTVVSLDGGGNLQKQDVVRPGSPNNTTKTDAIAIGNMKGSVGDPFEVVISDLAGSKLLAFEQNAGNWALAGGTSIGAGCLDVAVADLNGGVDEIFCTRQTLPTTWGFVMASYTTAYSTMTAPGGDGAPTWIRAGDIDGAFNKDFAVGGTGTNSTGVSVYRSTGGTSFNTSMYTTYATLEYGAAIKGMVIGDIDGDGTQGDIAVVVEGTPDQVYVSFRVASTSTYTLAGPWPVADGARSLALGDVDKNGKPDLATASETDDSVTILFQGTSGRSFYAYDFDGLSGAGEVFVALDDINNDSKVDIVTINKTTNAVAVTFQ